MPVTRQDKSRQLTLKCLIEGESTVFSVIVGRDFEVSDLKKAIQREGAPIENVDPQNLQLWKVSAIDESLSEVTSLSFSQRTPRVSRPCQPTLCLNVSGPWEMSCRYLRIK